MTPEDAFKEGEWLLEEAQFGRETLEICSLSLTALPESLRLLTILQLDDNKCGVAPEWIGRMTQLEILSLTDTGISDLPEWIGELRQLKQLYLDGNKLTSLPISLAGLPHMEALYLHGNDGLEIPQEVLGQTWLEIGPEDIQAARPADILDYYFKARRAAVR